MAYPRVLEQVIEQLSRWPSVGPKTAERFAFYLLKQKPETIRDLADSFLALQSKLTRCERCRDVTVENPCAICRDNNRNQALLCVVADSRDLLAIEETKQYKGLYHVLNGTISAINSASRDQLSINELLSRLRAGTIEEIILAFNPDIEGETTALYLLKIMTGINIKISRLARGLPAGASLDYADPMTLSHALNYRNHIK
ncbi:MAG TPA: recombination mediator RecR [bacterium]|nr:recombination mediator RecR [bacterium]